MSGQAVEIKRSPIVACVRRLIEIMAELRPIYKGGIYFNGSYEESGASQWLPSSLPT